MNDVVLFSPNRFSLYTICVTELLRRNNVNIKAIVVRRLVNPRRLFSEFNRDGYRLLRKIWKKLVLRKKGYRSTDYETITRLMERENIKFTKVEDFRNSFGIPVVYCDDLNEPVVVDLLKKVQPNLVIFTGGGIIRDEVLRNSGAGILNCHMGILPRYRGMDVIEWPILENNQEEIGVTVHFMDKGVDTGPILQTSKIAPAKGESIGQLRDRFEPIMCRKIVEGCLDYLGGRSRAIAQDAEAGRQYFVMHPRLMEMAQYKIRFRVKDP